MVKKPMPVNIPCQGQSISSYCAYARRSPNLHALNSICDTFRIPAYNLLKAVRQKALLNPLYAMRLPAPAYRSIILTGDTHRSTARMKVDMLVEN
jgi:hypothetical protein